MSKPLGVAMTLSQGIPSLRVTRPDRWMDMAWELAEEARAAHVPIEHVIDELRDAWAQSLEDEAKEVRGLKR